MIARIEVECNDEKHHVSVWDPGDEEKCGHEHGIVSPNGKIICCEDHEVELDLTIADLTGMQPMCISLADKIEVLTEPTPPNITIKAPYKKVTVLDSSLIDMLPTLLLIMGDINFNEGKYLFKSVEWGTIDDVKKLHKYGANLKIKNGKALVVAAERYARAGKNTKARSSAMQIIKYLVDNGVTTKYATSNALSKAASTGEYKIIKLFIDLGADATVNEDVVIRRAAEKGSVKVIELLVEHGASVTANANEVISIATESSNYEVVKYLIKEGVDLRQRRFHAMRTYYRSPLESATNHADMKMIDILLEPTYRQVKGMVEFVLNQVNRGRKSIRLDEPMVKKLYDFLEKKKKAAKRGTK